MLDFQRTDVYHAAQLRKHNDLFKVDPIRTKRSEATMPPAIASKWPPRHSRLAHGKLTESQEKSFKKDKDRNTKRQKCVKNTVKYENQQQAAKTTKNEKHGKSCAKYLTNCEKAAETTKSTKNSKNVQKQQKCAKTPQKRRKSKNDKNP